MLGSPRFSPATQRVLQYFVAAPSRWVHGYTLLFELDLASGTLYPVLMRLADAGWLATRWDLPAEGGRARHQYRLAAGALPHGRAVLREWRARGFPGAAPRQAT